MTTRNHWLAAGCLGLSLLLAGTTEVKALLPPEPGIAGAAVATNGAGFVYAQPSSAFQVSAVTLETWFMWDGGVGPGVHFLMGKGMENLEIHLTVPLGIIRFIPTTGVYVDTPAGMFVANQWTHVACVYDPSAPYAKIYVNGIQVPAINNGPNPIGTPINYVAGAPFYMGCRLGGGYILSGALDEVRVWNGVRTEAQIQETFAVPLAGPQPGLVGSWHFNEGVGTSAADASGNGLTGTLVTFGGSGPSWIVSGVMLVPLLDTVGAVALALLLVGGATVILRRRQALLLTQHAS